MLYMYVILYVCLFQHAPNRISQWDDIKGVKRARHSTSKLRPGDYPAASVRGRVKQDNPPKH
jgi:hypothetical protein